jgi:FkbM family methyltransferase
MKQGYEMQIDIRSRTEKWAFVTGEYDCDVIDYISGLLNQPGSVVLDIGANIGFYTVPLGLHLRELGGQLYAFEPVKSNFSVLSHNVTLNELSKTVSLHQLALGEYDGSIDLAVETNGGAGTGNAVMVTSGTESILAPNSIAPIRPLDDFATERGIDSCAFIKIDIEGGEYGFLSGALEFIEAYRPIIFGEFNPYWLKMQGHIFSDIMDLLRPFGYVAFTLDCGSLRPIGPPDHPIQDVFLLSE